MNAEGLLGRERELASAAGFLADVASGPAALTFEGEPGSGKTTLLRHVARAATDRGYRVLAAEPTNAERTLSFVALTDLLADARALFAALPIPQRRALEVALLLEAPDGPPPDPRAIGMGVLGVFRALSAAQPIIVAVDDAQWLDPASSGALAFALRRLTNERVALLCAERTGAEAVLELDSMPRARRVVVRGLSVGAVHALLVERLGLSVPRSVLIRVHDASGGNPLTALEIGRALIERGVPEPGEPFDVPSEANALLGTRLERLSDEAREALAVVAASVNPTRELVRAVTARPATEELDEAVHANVLRLEGGRILFTHPLLASAAYALLDAHERAALHRRIAAIVGDPEDRARHLALGAESPDAGVAAALDDAARHAAARGAPSAAAELAELAVKLSPVGDAERHARMTAAAEWHLLSGDSIRSRAILDRLMDDLPRGAKRARVLLMLAETHSGHQLVTLPLRERAVSDASGDDRVLTEALCDLAITLFISGHPGRALECARDAAKAAERCGDARLLVESLAYVALLETWDGHVTPGILERAVALERDEDYLRVYRSPRVVAALRAMLLHDDVSAARAGLEHAERSSRDRGDDEARCLLFGHLAEVECRTGRLSQARTYAAESLALREQFGFGTGTAMYYLALADGMLGGAAAWSEGERARELGEESSNEVVVVRSLRLLGFVALSKGEPKKAVDLLAPLPDRLVACGYGPTRVFEALPDAIEALIATRQLDLAAKALERLEDVTRTLATASARARTARCQGLLAIAHRDADKSLDALANATTEHERAADPLELGRTLLALGQVQLHAGRRRDARDTLHRGLAIFDEIGASLWSARAHVELGRVGGRSPAGDALTDAEARIARLVADGHTNKEVAAALFVTERTVETHLSSVYRKLGVRHRSELAARVAGGIDRHIP